MDVADSNEAAALGTIRSRKLKAYRIVTMAALLALMLLVLSVIGLQLVHGAVLQAMVKETRLQGRRDAVLVQVGKVRNQLDDLASRLDKLEATADDNIRRLDVIESIRPRP